jgi:hypothetical protein
MLQVMLLMPWKKHYSMNESDRIKLRVCGAIITHHRTELLWASSLPEGTINSELAREVMTALEVAPVPGQHGLVRLTMYLPAWVQYVGQRAILLFPKLSARLLRSSGLHHQMY